MKLDHVGVAVESIDEALKFYRDQLGLHVVHKEDVEAQKVRVAFLAGSKDGGEASVELLEPLGEGAVSAFLASRGPGLHHVAFETDMIERSMERLKAHGRPPLDEKPRPGARGHKVCFIHPKHVHGVLVELVSPPEAAQEHP